MCCKLDNKDLGSNEDNNVDHFLLYSLFWDVFQEGKKTSKLLYRNEH